MISFKSHPIKEGTALTPAQLANMNSATKEPRIDILMRLIKDKKPLELIKGGTFIVGDEYIDQAISNCQLFKKNQDHFGRSGFTLIDKEGKEIKSNDLLKSKVMGGGGGGAGSGTADTERNESHNACMMRAIVDDGYNNDIEHFDQARIAKAHSTNGTNNISANTDKILETPDDWNQSSYFAAKWLAENKYINKSQTFHRGDKKMNAIYALKNIAYKNNGFKALKDDKWNPGDVWAMAKDFNPVKEIDVTSVSAMNRSLIEHFNTRRCVGISLKMVKKYPPYNKEHNNQVPPDSDLHKLKALELESNRGDFWSSKSATIVYDTGSMNLKDNSPGSTVKAEIKGKTSRGGGISWGEMVEFVRRETGKNMGAHAKAIKPIAKKIEKELSKGNDRTVKKNWYPLYNEFYKNVSYKDMLEQLKQKDWTWISAKYAEMLLFYHIQKAGGTKANAIITHMINYAGSAMVESAVYIKVGK